MFLIHVSEYIYIYIYIYTCAGATIECDLQCDNTDPRLLRAIEEIEDLSPNEEITVKILKAKEVPWFPLNLNDLEILTGNREPEGGESVESAERGAEELPPNHPGFKDEVYLERRRFIGNLCRSHRVG